MLYERHMQHMLQYIIKEAITMALLLSTLCIQNFIKYNVEEANKQTKWEPLEFLLSDMTSASAIAQKCPMENESIGYVSVHCMS